MPKSIWAKNSFSFGEISKRSWGRFDSTKPIYRDGAAILENFQIFQHGSAFYRPGSQYVATAGQVAPVRLEPFSYSIEESYILEFGNEYLQFYANGGSIASKITTPYLQANLFNLDFAGKQDVSYIANPNYPQYKLIRTSATSFIIQKVQFLGGPFLDSNVSGVTITPSSDTGATTLTATIPAWVTGTQYISGDFVTNSGITYRCQLTHIAGTFATDLTNNDWVVDSIFKAGHVGSIWQINNTVGALQWTANASYPVGFIVYFNGVTYKCLVANTSSSSFLADLAAGDWQVFGGTVLITGYTSATVVTGVV